MKEHEYIEVYDIHTFEIREYGRKETVLKRFGKGTELVTSPGEATVHGTASLGELLERGKDFSWEDEHGNHLSIKILSGKSKYKYSVLDLHQGYVRHFENLDETAHHTGERVALEKHLRQHIRIPLAGRYLVQETRDVKPWDEVYGVTAYKKKHHW